MFNKEKVKLGIAPIAWTNDDLPDLGKENTFEQCVARWLWQDLPAQRWGTNIRRTPKC